MVRLATIEDAEQLGRLNEDFNGEGETTLEAIRDSLANNSQEIVIVDEEMGKLAGFVCVQVKRSFCYAHRSPEITEVYVAPAYRRRGIAGEMIAFVEAYCAGRFPVRKFELLTGKRNTAAQAVYRKSGYEDDGELHFSKRVK